MANPIFNAKINLTNAVQIDIEMLEWELTFNVTDADGVFSGLTTAVDDALLIDTSGYDSGTLTRYRITSIVSQGVSEVVANVVMDDNNTVIPDLNFALGIDGAIMRPTPTKGLSILPSPSTQILPDRFAVYPRNADNFQRLDEGSGGGATGPTGSIQVSDGSGGLTGSSFFTSDGEQVLIHQAAETTVADEGSYGFALSQEGDLSLTIGTDDDNVYIQSWSNKSLIFNHFANPIEFRAEVSLADNKITNLADPVNPQDAATRGWVLENLAPGLTWTKYTLSYTDFQTAATSNSITLTSLAAGEVVEKVLVKHTEAFDGDFSLYELSVGISGDLEKYSSSFDVTQAVSSATKQISTSVDVENLDESTLLLITAVSTGANLNTATAGAVSVYVQTSLLPD